MPDILNDEDLSDAGSATEAAAERGSRAPRTGRAHPARVAARTRANPRARPQDKRAQSEPDPEPRMEARAPEERLYRQRPEGGFDFSIAKDIIPQGWSYEWKRKSYLGKQDTRHMNSLRLNHWSDVPASRHPELASEDPHGAIVVDGMVLMERPAYLTKEAREESLGNAYNQVRSVTDRMKETPQGTLSRSHESAKRHSFVKRDYEAFDPSTISE